MILWNHLSFCFFSKLNLKLFFRRDDRYDDRRGGYDDRRRDDRGK